MALTERLATGGQAAELRPFVSLYSALWHVLAQRPHAVSQAFGGWLGLLCFQKIVPNSSNIQLTSTLSLIFCIDFSSYLIFFVLP